VSWSSLPGLPRRRWVGCWSLVVTWGSRLFGCLLRWLIGRMGLRPALDLLVVIHFQRMGSATTLGWSLVGSGDVGELLPPPGSCGRS
jgi:hypothetical protein